MVSGQWIANSSFSGEMRGRGRIRMHNGPPLIATGRDGITVVRLQLGERLLRLLSVFAAQLQLQRFLELGTGTVVIARRA